MSIFHSYKEDGRPSVRPSDANKDKNKNFTVTEWDRDAAAAEKIGKVTNALLKIGLST